MAWYFGADSGTTSNPCGTQFYLGRMGYGETVSVKWPYSGSAPSFAYWNIEGPGTDRNLTQATAWGKVQADAFWNRFWTGQWPGGTIGYTMFGAVSQGSGGWLTSGTYNGSTYLELNRGVVDGFLEELAYDNNGHTYSESTTLGLYGSQGEEFGTLLDAVNSGWQAAEPVVIWVADYGSFSSCSAVESAYCPMPTIAGYFPMIWQYQGSPDYDITPYDGGLSSAKSYTWHPVAPPGIC